MKNDKQKLKWIGDVMPMPWLDVLFNENEKNEIIQELKAITEITYSPLPSEETRPLSAIPVCSPCYEHWEMQFLVLSLQGTPPRHLQIVCPFINIDPEKDFRTLTRIVWGPLSPETKKEGIRYWKAVYKLSRLFRKVKHLEREAHAKLMRAVAANPVFNPELKGDEA